MASLKGAAGPFVGLDIGAGYIKVVEARLARGRAEITGLGVLPTPTGLVDNNVVLDPQALGRVLKELFAKSNISAKKVVSSIAGQSSLVVRIIPVPKMTRSELNETMKWEIERHVPFPANETVWDFQPLSDPDAAGEGENIQVLLAVAQEMLVNAHVETLAAAGLQPVAIDVEPLASSRALLDLEGDSGAVGVVAVVDMGSNTSDVSIFRDGVINFTRTMPIAGRSFTQAISETTGQPLHTAERLKKEFAHVPEGLPLAQAAFDDQFGGFPGFGDDATDFGADVETTAPPGGGLDFTSPAPGEPLDGPIFDMGLDPDAPAAGPRQTLDLGADDSPFGGPGEFTGEFTAPVSAAVQPLDESDEGAMRQQVTDAITPILGELVTELRRSLDYYRNNTGHGIDRMLICGGTARLPGLDTFLSAQLGLPVEVANPLRSVGVPAKMDQSYLQEVAPVFAVSLGLAVREMLTNGATGRSKGR
jgi:type IV pilus assembly protein PilM